MYYGIKSNVVHGNCQQVITVDHPTLSRRLPNVPTHYCLGRIKAGSAEGDRNDRDAQGEPTGELLFLVCETKGEDEIEKLRISERRKVYCAKRHFEDALDVRYEQTSTVGRLF